MWALDPFQILLRAARRQRPAPAHRRPRLQRRDHRPRPTARASSSPARATATSSSTPRGSTAPTCGASRTTPGYDGGAFFSPDGVAARVARQPAHGRRARGVPAPSSRRGSCGPPRSTSSSRGRGPERALRHPERQGQLRRPRSCTTRGASSSRPTIDAAPAQGRAPNFDLYVVDPDAPPTMEGMPPARAHHVLRRLRRLPHVLARRASTSRSRRTATTPARMRPTSSSPGGWSEARSIPAKPHPGPPRSGEGRGEREVSGPLPSPPRAGLAVRGLRRSPAAPRRPRPALSPSPPQSPRLVRLARALGLPPAGARTTALAAVKLPDGGCAFTAEGGQRWTSAATKQAGSRVVCAGKAEASPAVAAEDLTSAIRRGDGAWIYVGESGALYEAGDPLGAFTRTVPAPEPLAKVTGRGRGAARRHAGGQAPALGRAQRLARRPDLDRRWPARASSISRSRSTTAGAAPWRSASPRRSSPARTPASPGRRVAAPTVGARRARPHRRRRARRAGRSSSRWCGAAAAFARAADRIVLPQDARSTSRWAAPPRPLAVAGGPRRARRRSLLRGGPPRERGRPLAPRPRAPRGAARDRAHRGQRALRQHAARRARAGGLPRLRVLRRHGDRRRGAAQHRRGHDLERAAAPRHPRHRSDRRRRLARRRRAGHRRVPRLPDDRGVQAGPAAARPRASSTGEPPARRMGQSSAPPAEPHRQPGGLGASSHREAPRSRRLQARRRERRRRAARGVP